MNTKLIILTGVALLIVGLMIFGAANREFVNSVAGSSAWFLPVLIVAALVDSVNPCAFSVLILTIAFLTSIGKGRGRIAAIGASYIAGIFVIYLLIGLGIATALAAFGAPHIVARVGAVILIVVGCINVLNELVPGFPIRTKIPQAAHRTMALLMERASFPTAFVLGLFVGLSEFPCTGGPYLLVLGLLHDRTTFWQGFGYLVIYNLIFVLPLIIILIVASDRSVLARIEEWKRTRSAALRFWGGVAMILLGALILLL